MFPWVVSLAFYPGNSLGALINWSSAILFVALNFVLPLKLYTAVNSDEGRRHLLRKMAKAGDLVVGDDGGDPEDAAADPTGAAAATGSIQLSAVSPAGKGAGASSEAGADASPWSAGRSALRFVMGTEAPPAASGANEPLMAAGAAAGHAAADGLGRALEPSEYAWEGAEDIQELPDCWPRCCGARTVHLTANAWLWSSAVIGVVCFILQIVSVADPSFAG